MKGSSITDVIQILEDLSAVSDEYKHNEDNNIVNHLFVFNGTIDANNIPKIFEALAKYSVNQKLLGRFDLPFLTLSSEKSTDHLEGYLKIFNELDNDIKVQQLGCFKERPDGLYERLDFCIKNGVPYKDENNLLFKEVNFATESGLYLRAMVLAEQPKYELTDVQKSIFKKICGMLQTRTYKYFKEKLSITDELAESIIEIVKSDPSLTEDDTDSVLELVINKNPFLRVITEEDTKPFYSEISKTYSSNGRR